MLRDEKVYADAGAKLEERITPRAAGRDRQHLGLELSLFRRQQRLRAGAAGRQRRALQALRVRHARAAAHIAETLHEAGVPRGRVHRGDRSTATGAALLRQPIDGVFFTGSYATGARASRDAAGRAHDQGCSSSSAARTRSMSARTSTSRPPPRASPTAPSTTPARSCCSVERIYVHETIHDAFVAAFVAEVKGYKVGRPDGRGDLHRRRSPAGRSSRCCDGRSPTPSARARSS